MKLAAIAPPASSWNGKLGLAQMRTVPESAGFCALPAPPAPPAESDAPHAANPATVQADPIPPSVLRRVTRPSARVLPFIVSSS
jgi:hypothetical protein